MIKRYKNSKITTKINSLIGIAIVIIALLTSLGKDFLERPGLYVGSYANNAKIFIIAVSFVFMVIMIASGYYIRKCIKKPLDEIVKAIKIIGDGGVEIELEKYNEDEFGIIIDALNATVKNIKDDANIADEIAEGDLSMDVSPRTDIDELGKSFKKLLDDHNHVLGNIREASMQVTTGSEQVASASQSLAQGSTEQASALEEITASIDDIAQRTKVNAAEANNANKLVIETKAGAVKGNAQMKEMMIAMNEINESSENISKIIKVIDDIAFQTNILALNAAVEAARAGTHGKGFAVVAEEVRNLAAKSAQAASETAELIENSIGKVEKGSKIAEETGAALAEIVENIDKIVDIISEIATASNEQATAVTQIDQALGQVSQVVQSNSATSEQCAAASEELSNQAIRLRELISKFKLREYSQPYYQKSVTNDNEKIISLGNGFGKY
ncbi:MAG: methyl-accepting chemotaxis protein [Lachnospiraceae bacterium]|nr:methyl-accepting chemotaxis protein [Lachnospiraceae bacterium]